MSPFIYSYKHLSSLIGYMFFLDRHEVPVTLMWAALAKKHPHMPAVDRRDRLVRLVDRQLEKEEAKNVAVQEERRDLALF